MIRPPKNLSTVDMMRETERSAHYAQDLIKRATRLQTDSDKEKRLAAGLCKGCHYVSSRLGGAAMTSQPCAGCATPQMYGSTYTDALCLACAKEHKLCKHCGGDSEMRTMRRKWPTFTAGIPYKVDGF